MLHQQIYYLDNALLEIIQSDFVLIDRQNWFELYKNKIDNSLWRLDAWDKYQEQYFVRIGSEVDWIEFDATSLQIDLLRSSRGTTDQNCKWVNCERNSLNGLVFCEFHAYKEMGIRR